MRHIAILGIGVLGYNIARHVAKRGVDVIAVDRDKRRVELVKDFVLHAGVADITDEEALRKLGVQNADLAVVSIGDSIEASILATALLKKMELREIWARAINPLQSQVLELLGVTHIIHLEEEMGRQVALSIVTPKVERFVEITEHINLVEIEPNEKFAGRSLIEADLRNRYEMNVIAIRRFSRDEDGKVTETIKELPRASDIIHKGDVLIVIGSSSGIDKFRRENT